MTEVCLGIDPNVKRLGLALVAFEPPHEVLWADTVSIDRVDGGWTHQQVGAAVFGAYLTAVEGLSRRYWISRIGIEIPPYVKNAQVFRQLSIVFGLVGAECHSQMSDVPQVSCDVGSWKREVLGKGNASKAEVMDWAIRAYTTPRDPMQSFSLDQDSADAIAIATYAAGVELVERGAA